MKLLIVGATGKTGHSLLELALADGHQVTALARHPDELTAYLQVSVIEGDVLDAEVVKRAVMGQDAVLSTVGATNPSEETTLNTDATHNLIVAMEETGVRRFVGISMLGAGDSAAHADFLYKNVLLPTQLKRAREDKEGMEREAMESFVDWTLVRPPLLTDDPATGDYAVLEATDEGTVHKISREDLAAFLLSCVVEGRYIGEAVIVGR